MKPKKLSIKAGAGKVTAVLLEPDEPSGIAVVLAHGAGADMTAALVVGMAEALAARGHTTLRFNFLYTELGKKAPDRAPVLEATYHAVLEAMRKRGHGRLVIGGKSMGGRYATIIASKGEACDGVLLLGYPLHPPGKPKQLRDEHLASIPVPMLFFSGTRDPLCELPLMRKVMKRLPRATLHVIDGADHSLDLPKSANRPRPVVYGQIADTTDAWLRALPRVM